MSYLYPFRRGAGRRTQNYGTNPGWVLNGVQVNPSGGHTGFDDAVPVGTPVHAAADGFIDAARTFHNYNNEWLYGPMGGLTLVLDTGDNRPSFGYSHLSRVLVREGEFVRKGQVVALSGNSGSSTTGAHAHVEAMPPKWAVGNGTYGRVNPDLYFDEYPGEIAVQSTATTVKEEPMPEPEWYNAMIKAQARIDEAVAKLPADKDWYNAMIQAQTRIDSGIAVLLERSAP